MSLSIESTKNLPLSNSIESRKKSGSTSTSSAKTTNKWMRQTDKNIWRAIDFLHIAVMIFSLFTATIVAILRNELAEQCPLYAKLYLRANATNISSDIIDRQSIWGGVYTCEFVSFAYLSSFVISFISLWIHVVFRRVLRTERLLRLPIGLFTLIFALIAFIATIVATDGVIKLCENSQGNLCSSLGPQAFSRSRWKLVSLPVGGWLTTVALLLNVLVRGVQLFAKPKQSRETVKLLVNQLMNNRNQSQNKTEKESSEYGSQISRQSIDKNRVPSFQRYPNDPIYNRELPSELYPYHYPPVPQYRQIEKRSRFRRICCPCFQRRRRRRRSTHEPYRPFVVPEEYFHRLNYLKQNGAVPANLCHRHSIHHPIERQTQTDLTPQRKSIDETSEVPFLPRRRSSVRFEDEISPVNVLEEPTTTTTPKSESIPIIKNDDEGTTVNVSENNLERNVSFRNNEDDLWTTITVNTEQCLFVQSSHFNRLSVDNLSVVDTSNLNNDNRVTAIHVNSKPIESLSSEPTDNETVLPPEPSFKIKPKRSISNNHTVLVPLAPPLPPPPPSASRSLTTSSEDDSDLRNIKPVEEIHAIVTDKYNYNNLSRALKSNVERLKSTFTHVQESHSYYDTPRNISTKLSSQRSFQNSTMKNHLNKH